MLKDPATMKPHEHYSTAAPWLPISLENGSTILCDHYKQFLLSPPTGQARYLMVNPAHADQIYIFDQDPAEIYRQECFLKVTYLTDEQYNTYRAMPSSTLIPISDYRGGYKSPQVLVGRELSLSEVSVVVRA